MKLITETIEGSKVITEAKAEGGKYYYIQGPFMVADQVNNNKRLYESSILERECKRFMTEMVAKKRAFGECGHPQGPGINLDRVSHMIENMEQQNNIFIGRAKILDTPMGLTIQKLLEAGGLLGVSTRGMGSLVPHKDGYNMVQPDFHLATVDIVADPSAPGAFVQGIMEGKEWIFEGGVFKEVDLMDARKKINEGARKRQTDKAMIEAFERFLGSL